MSVPSQKQEYSPRGFFPEHTCFTSLPDRSKALHRDRYRGRHPQQLVGNFLHLVYAVSIPEVTDKRSPEIDPGAGKLSFSTGEKGAPIRYMTTACVIPGLQSQGKTIWQLPAGFDPLQGNAAIKQPFSLPIP